MSEVLFTYECPTHRDGKAGKETFGALFIDGKRHRFGGHTWTVNVPSGPLWDYVCGYWPDATIEAVDRRVLTNGGTVITSESIVRDQIKVLADAMALAKQAEQDAARARQTIERMSRD